MKKLIILLAIFSVSTFGELTAQDYVQLLKTQQYDKLETYLSPQVKVEINRDDKVLSRDRAIARLKEKLETFNIVKWEKMHNGTSNTEDSGYLIVKAFDKENNGLRIFFYLEEKNGQKNISAIRVRKLL